MNLRITLSAALLFFGAGGIARTHVADVADFHAADLGSNASSPTNTCYVGRGPQYALQAPVIVPSTPPPSSAPPPANSASGPTVKVTPPVANQTTGNSQPRVTAVPSDPTPSTASVGDVNDPLVPNPENFPLTEKEREAIRLTNKTRREAGKSILIVSPRLMREARSHSAASNGSYRGSGLPQHSALGGMENVGGILGTLYSAKQWIDMWLGSAGHLQNILNAGTYIGVGFSDTFGTQRFA